MPGGTPAESPGHDDLGEGAGEMPEGHPDSQRKGVARRVGARLFRHYRFLAKRQEDLRQQHAEDVDLMFTGLGKLADRVAYAEEVLAVVQERPESVALGRIEERSARMQAEAREFYARRDAEWELFLREMRAASRALFVLTDQLLDKLD